jgi:hypothetical protein
MERDHSEDFGVDGRTILKWISRIWMEGIDWIHLVQDIGQRWALVNSVMNVRVHESQGMS